MPSPASVDYRSLILSSDLPEKKRVAGLIRRAIIASPCVARAIPKLGASRLGGEPDLPSRFPWPRWKGRSQPFVAQIDLAELPQVPGRELLPPRGHLYFFYALDCDPENSLPQGYDREERGAFPVFFRQAPSAKISRRAFPRDLPDRCEWPPLSLRFSVEDTVPCVGHFALERLGINTPPLRGRYMDLLGKAVWPSRRMHNQILGHASPIQNLVEEDAEGVFSGYCPDPKNQSKAQDALRKKVQEGTLQWELLLQVDSHMELNGMCWGDLGRLYWVMRRRDLLARRFERAWCLLQCS